MFVGIANTPRDYAWGSRTALAEYLGTEPSGRPEAELWLGAHPGSPARLTDGSGDLRDVAGGGLPFLLKVLAAASPLSLQAHPTPEQARDGYARENAAGVPLDAAHRNYKDENAKPELIVAVSETFDALCGFRPVVEARASLDRLGDDPRLDGLRSRLADDGALPQVFEWLITRGEGVDDLVAAVVELAAGADGLEFATVRRLAAAYPGDPGIVISLLLNTVRLSRGEALYLPAGNIHAYLEGLGIELMSASDNVLRGGLTPKHVDVPELLTVLDFTPRPVPYLWPEEPQPGVRVFRPDVPDFVLFEVTVGGGFAGDASDGRGAGGAGEGGAGAGGGDGTDAGASGGTGDGGDRARLPLAGPAIALCTAGAVRLEGAAGTFSLGRGESCFLTPDELELTLTGTGRVFVATTNPLQAPQAENPSAESPVSSDAPVPFEN